MPHALNSLSIWDFNGVEALPEWLGNLSSLQSLEIWNCKNLKYLPRATDMQRLSKLRNLRIAYCSFLGANCAKGRGSEWPKISHIPDVRIGYVSLFVLILISYLGHQKLQSSAVKDTEPILHLKSSFRRQKVEGHADLCAEVAVMFANVEACKFVLKFHIYGAGKDLILEGLNHFEFLVDLMQYYGVV
ncbi:hypothetical protein GH714_013989 [Hevea brasiliensis]|uniref:R13L1/DRL21-like LRR repeat region domain-containing protein n=1 Tax=Hevea brasiliensis TaxID=3981 RepID=A0A6A6MZG4_HEVBR|nr:hypothetical protein GH714_013989 [Hevea brasiliensis]